MEKINDPFTYYYPSIDLHGLDRISAVIKVKNYNILVVHGKGEFILKKEVHNYLKIDKRVESYKSDNFNDGMTIIKLKED